MTSDCQHPVIPCAEAMALLQHQRVCVLRSVMDNPVDKSSDRHSDSYLPGAVDVDLDGPASAQDAALSHSLPTVSAQQTLFGQCGVSLATPVVVYDNRGMFSAARVYWMLRALGHTKVSLLDGGLPAWQRAGYLTNREAAVPVHRLFEAAPQPGWFVDLPQVAAASEQGGQIVDARGPARFSGEQPDPRPDVKAGHIPGSVNLHYQQVLDAQTGQFLPSEQLAALFAERNIDLGQPIICTCGSGITACIIGVAALLCGARQVSVYDGSWAEWGSSDQPVATL